MTLIFLTVSVSSRLVAILLRGKLTADRKRLKNENDHADYYEIQLVTTEMKNGLYE